MHRILAALLFAAVPQAVLAQPPAEGTTHTFYDPVFVGTVVCDTLDEVREIANSDQPEQVYQGYLTQMNEHNEPICAAIVPTGLVLDVTPLGVMVRDEKHFNAWAVETKVGAMTGFALYLEHFDYVIA